MESQSSDHPSARIIWLSGPFGTGKSAIQQTIAERCDEAGTLAASFFFSHQSSERNNSRKFVPTVAWQVAKSVPDARRHIEAAAVLVPMDNHTPSYNPFPSVPERTSFNATAAHHTLQNGHPTPSYDSFPAVPESTSLFPHGRILRLDPTVTIRNKGPLASLVEKDLASQLSALINEPLKLTARYQSQSQSQVCLDRKPQPNVLIIDGLDECKDEEQQLEIITVLHAAVIEHKLPFLIIISSRPDEAIDKCFSRLWGPIFERIDLKTNQDADKDIELVLRATFRDICGRHGIAPGTWPEEADIAQMVRNASGHFIYTSIALKLIDGPYPQEILRTTGHPLAHLDVLYSLLLKRCNNPKKAVITLLAINRYSQEVTDRPNVELDLNASDGRHISARRDTLDMGLEEGFKTKLLSPYGLLPSEYCLGGVGGDPSVGTIPDRRDLSPLGYSWFRRIDVEHFFQDEIDTNLFFLFKSMPAWADTDSHISFYHKSVMDFLDDPLRSEDLYVGQNTFYGEILPYYLDFYNGTSGRLDDNQLLTREQLQELHDDFLRFLPLADLRKRDLQQKLKAYDLAWWSALSSSEMLSNFLWVFHQGPLGCDRFKCSRTCSKWQKLVTQRCTSSGCSLPPRPTKRLDTRGVILGGLLLVVFLALSVYTNLGRYRSGAHTVTQTNQAPY
ncbi:hypothetical protein FA15DRAFT_697413 [Coprinopsis marcescibilis]|uniref:Nephrocystin 3-like N-terminal domain-containing protein n=1 Tax=Coprinopsis marcescibilis TaxID=230819 RepID=A0A5C3KHK4_COPMA|nr:hypothetical protein FA15DRAFT_697413 [Coprinopsis marcescibilis]